MYDSMIVMTDVMVTAWWATDGVSHDHTQILRVH
jgi:hypothetical protein